MQKKYKVRWNYKSSLGGPWTKGSVIELDEILAGRVNIDSPEVLMAVPEAPERKNRLGVAESTREKVNSEAPVNEENPSTPENEPDPALQQREREQKKRGRLSLRKILRR